MNWNDCEALWKRQPLPVGRTADVEELKAAFEIKRRKMAAALLVRDVLEGGTGLLMSLVLGIIWWKMGWSHWPMGLAIALLLGVSGLFIRERVRARRLRLGADAPLLAKVEADLAELQHQRHLLLTMRTWYLGPVFVAALMVLAAVYFRARAWEPVRSPWFTVGFALFFLLVSWFAWAINRRAVRMQLEPRIAELEKLRGDLRGED